MDSILYLLVAGAFCGIFGGVIYVLAKKENAKDEERVKSLTKEQVDTLTNTPYQAIDGLPNAALVHGLILEIPKVTNSKAELVVMYYNEYYPNFRGQISHADVNVKIKEFTEHNLKVGDYVKMLLNEDKSPKIKF